jgi:hypothetical protein
MVMRRLAFLVACVVVIGAQATYAREHLRSSSGTSGAGWDLVSVTEYSPCDANADNLAMRAAMNHEEGVLGPAW